ncbi:dTDP-4-dehydrorhamnose 3,5-epimerase [Thermodesulfobacteriota bacterium]
MEFINTSLPDAYIIKLKPHQDSRGVFSRLICKKELRKIGHAKEIFQVNHSVTSKKGSVRGMHFQHPPKAEIKMVKCLHGSVFDVIIDLRSDSKTMLKWHGEILTAENMKMMYIPEGFAHGFQAMEKSSELLYFHTEFYNPEYEGGIRYDDPLVNIEWPLTITDISKRDQSHPLLTEDFKGVNI